MNLVKLKRAEEMFLDRYPGGFENPEIVAIRKKRHNVDKMVALAQESFSKRRFEESDQVIQNMLKVVSQSSIISVFEKPRFKDFVYSLSSKDRILLANGLQALLRGKQQKGSQTILDLLKSGKLAKWPLMTIYQTYFHSHRDVFVKPTTVKGIIEYFELKDLHYKPIPSWAFYDEYRSTILEMKSKVDGSLAPTNLAFSWFLLLSFHGNVSLNR
jgi:hypothetical protein